MTPIRQGRYTIRVWPDGQQVSGRAMLLNSPVTPQRHAETAEALGAIISADLGEHSRRIGEGRGPSDVPRAAEFEEVLLFLHHRMSDGQTQMLRALYEAEARTLTATQLAAAAAQDSFSFANLHFGTLARMIAEEIGYTPSVRDDGTVRWTTTLAVGADALQSEDSAHFRWRMRPEVAEALSGRARIALTAPTKGAKK
jgi:hypothetical protein